MSPAPAGLEVTLQAPESSPRKRRIPFVLVVRNVSGRPFDLYLRGREATVDVEVTTEDGHPVWQRLSGRIIPEALQLRTLPPDESLAVRVTWNQRGEAGPAAAGNYLVRATLLTEGAPIEAPIHRLVITP